MAMALNENIRNDLVTIGTTPVLISPARTNTEVILTNTSSAGQNITVSVGTVAKAKYGIFLLPFSTYWTSRGEGYTPIYDEIWAVASAAGATLSVMQR